MLSPTAFRITSRACEIRVQNGEDIHEIVKEYIKLSDEQIAELIEKFTINEAEEEGVK